MMAATNPEKKMTYGLIRCGYPQLGLLVLVGRDTQYLMGCILLDIPVTVKGSNILDLGISQIRGVVFVELGRSLHFTVSIISGAGSWNIRSPWRVNKATPWIVSARTGGRDATATTKSFAKIECILIRADEYILMVILERGIHRDFITAWHKSRKIYWETTHFRRVAPGVVGHPETERRNHH